MVNCRFEKRRAHDEPLWCKTGQIDRKVFLAMSTFEALQKYSSAGSSARVKQIVESASDLIRRKARATFYLTDPVEFKFQVDCRASRVTDSTWPHQGNTVDPRRCKTSLVGQSTGLSVPRSPVRFRQKLQKSRTHIYI